MSKFNGNAITWFEVPTTDITRAVGFYETLLGKKLTRFPGEEPCFMFPAGEGSIVRTTGLQAMALWSISTSMGSSMRC